VIDLGALGDCELGNLDDDADTKQRVANVEKGKVTEVDTVSIIIV